MLSEAKATVSPPKCHWLETILLHVDGDINRAKQKVMKSPICCNIGKGSQNCF